MRDLRTLLVELHPPNLASAGLEAALSDLVSPLEAAGRRSSCGSTARTPRSASTQALVYRVAQEALRNVIAYADATNVSVEVDAVDRRRALLVADDGRGFAPDDARPAPPEGHLGLRSSRSSPGRRAEASRSTRAGRRGPASSWRCRPVIRVLIADDHGVIRDGLGGLIAAQPDMEVVGLAANGAEAVELVPQPAPDVVLMDLEMPGSTGSRRRARSSRTGPRRPCSSSRRSPTGGGSSAALDAGAGGYLLKDARPTRSPRHPRCGAGGSPLDPRAARLAARGEGRAGSAAGLSPREREVLALLVDGLPNKLIARRLEISEKTVKSHLTNVFRRSA